MGDRPFIIILKSSLDDPASLFYDHIESSAKDIFYAEEGDNGP